MTDIAGLCNALASDCDEGQNNNWENDDWKAASETLRQAADKISDLQSKLDFSPVAPANSTTDLQAKLDMAVEALEAWFKYDRNSAAANYSEALQKSTNALTAIEESSHV